MDSALLFGGSGQIGHALGKRLCAAGWAVTAVSRVRRSDEGGLHWLQADLAGQAQWPQQVDVIFSCGPLDLFSSWYASHPDVDCPRVVAFGSTSVLVKQDSHDASERALAAVLHASEVRVFDAASSRGAQATLLRPTLVYGTGRDQTLSRIARIASRSGWFVLPSGAAGLRQPVHVEDLAHAAHAAAEAPATHGRTYALPGGETLSYRDMVARTLATLRPPARLLDVPAPVFRGALTAARLLGRLGEASDAVLGRMRQDLVFDCDAARRDFGYAPRRFNPGPGTFGP